MKVDPFPNRDTPSTLLPYSWKLACYWSTEVLEYSNSWLLATSSSAQHIRGTRILWRYICLVGRSGRRPLLCTVQAIEVGNENEKPVTPLVAILGISFLSASIHPRGRFLVCETPLKMKVIILSQAYISKTRRDLRRGTVLLSIIFSVMTVKPEPLKLLLLCFAIVLESRVERVIDHNLQVKVVLRTRRVTKWSTVSTEFLRRATNHYILIYCINNLQDWA
jgi:hypothetical protein